MTINFVYLRTLLVASVLSLFFTQCSYLAYESTSPSNTSTNSSAGNSRLQKEIIDYASDLVGSKYTYGGDKPQSGFDCSGLTSYVLGNYDINLPHQSGAQEHEGQRVSPKNVAPGDLVFFRRSSAGKVFHVALVIENTADGIVVIHSTTSRGVIRENISQSTYWQPKISSARHVLK